MNCYLDYLAICAETGDALGGVGILTGAATIYH
jgi:hypothetical protein